MHPPWPARCEADNWGMQRYLEIRLQEIEHAEWTALWHDAAVPYTEPERLDYAIECAEAGDVRELRAELVRRIGDTRIIRFVNLPKLRKGERWSRKSDSSDRKSRRRRAGYSQVPQRIHRQEVSAERATAGRRSNSPLRFTLSISIRSSAT